ncbi:uncharacterized protein [Ptychodera flava]|uniref:uncharacterized protein n=1 Tax=Ptychodera flava TaxID=63121 RepID=UPI003969D913
MMAQEALLPSNSLRTVNEIVQDTIEFSRSNSSDPVEVLRYYQKKVVTGRNIDVESERGISGDKSTNFIIVNRFKLLETSFDEINAIEDLRKTLEVEFYSEKAQDYGGPRKEFFVLVLRELKEKYFDNGLKEHMAEDYETVGKIMALSMLQNGKLPRFLNADIISQLLTDDPATPCIVHLRKGLDALGIYQLFRGIPTFHYLFQVNEASALTMRKLMHLLKPIFSEEGSNVRT